MEALIVALCRAMTVRRVAQLLGGATCACGGYWIMTSSRRAREDFSGVTAIGLDETAARRGHHSISLFHDLEAPRLVFATEGRKAEVLAQFADDLKAHGGCAENIRDVCIDRSGSYRSGVAEQLPWANITFDEFHVIQLANRAVDAVRRAEVKSTPVLKRSRYLWLKDQQDWNRRQLLQYVDLRRLNLQTHLAYRIKESLREIFRLANTREEAEALLAGWYSRARRCRLAPMKDFAKTVKIHWNGILNALDFNM